MLETEPITNHGRVHREAMGLPSRKLLPLRRRHKLCDFTMIFYMFQFLVLLHAKNIQKVLIYGSYASIQLGPKKRAVLGSSILSLGRCREEQSQRAGKPKAGPWQFQLSISGGPKRICDKLSTETYKLELQYIHVHTAVSQFKSVQVFFNHQEATLALGLQLHGCAGGEGVIGRSKRCPHIFDLRGC